MIKEAGDRSLGLKYLYQSNFRVVTFKGFGDSQKSYAVQPEIGLEDFEPLMVKIDKKAKKKLVRQNSIVRMEKKAREDKKTVIKWKFSNPTNRVEEVIEPCFEENSAQLESEAPLSARAVDVLKGTHLDLANSFERDFAKPIEGD